MYYWVRTLAEWAPPHVIAAEIPEYATVDGTIAPTTEGLKYTGSRHSFNGWLQACAKVVGPIYRTRNLSPCSLSGYTASHRQP